MEQKHPIGTTFTVCKPMVTKATPFVALNFGVNSDTYSFSVAEDSFRYYALNKDIVGCSVIWLGNNPKMISNVERTFPQEIDKKAWGTYIIFKSDKQTVEYPTLDSFVRAKFQSSYSVLLPDCMLAESGRISDIRNIPTEALSAGLKVTMDREPGFILSDLMSIEHTDPVNFVTCTRKIVPSVDKVKSLRSYLEATLLCKMKPILSPIVPTLPKIKANKQVFICNNCGYEYSPRHLATLLSEYTSLNESRRYSMLCSNCQLKYHLIVTDCGVVSLISDNKMEMEQEEIYDKVEGEDNEEEDEEYEDEDEWDGELDPDD